MILVFCPKRVLSIFYKKLNIFLFCLLLFVASFFVSVKSTNAFLPEEELKNEENVVMNEADNEKIWLSIGQVLTNEWVDRLSSSSSVLENEAALSIIRTGRRAKLIKYFFSDTPKDISIKFVDATVKLIKVYISGDYGQLIGEIEKMSVEKAKKYLVEYLDKNKIKISTGNLPIQYKGSDNNPYKYNLPYIVALKEIEQEKFEIALGIYSSKNVKTLKSQIISGWIGGIDNLAPYIFRLSGIAKREIGSFAWVGKPKIEYIFNESVPEFDFKEPGFWDNTKNYFNDLLKDVNPFSTGAASVVSNMPNENGDDKDTSQDDSWLLDGQILKWSQSLKENINLFLKNIKLSNKEKEIEDNNKTENNEKQLTLEEIQEQIDDIAEQIDILKAEYARLYPDESETDSRDQKGDNSESVKPNNSLGSGRVNNSYQKLLITEVQTKGAGGEKDEFVELYNPNNTDIVLSDWYVQRKTKTSISYLSYATSKNFENKYIKANGYFLIARNGSNYSNIADLIIDKSLTDDNSLVIKNPNGDIVDKIGWGQASEYEAEPTLNHQVGKSIGRIKINNNNFKDTDNNKNDFEINIPTPKGNNQSLEINDVQPQKILINEIQTGDNEFLELYNPNNEIVDISNYYFSYYSRSRDWNNPYRNKKFPDDAKITGNGYYLIGLKGYTEADGNPNSDWQPYTSCFNNEEGSVAIFPWNPIEKTVDEVKTERIDAVGWGKVLVFENESIRNLENNMSLARKIEDKEMIDTDNNNLDFVISDPTPTNSSFDVSYKPIFSNLPWPNFQNDSGHSGLAPSLVINSEDNLRQNLINIFGASVNRSPKMVIGPKNNIYVITDEKEGEFFGKIYALSSDGSILWQFNQFDDTPAYIALSENGNVIVTTNKKIYSFDLITGAEIWNYSEDGIDGISGISIDKTSGKIYFSDYTGLHCLNSNGVKKWSKKDAPRGGSAKGGPVIGDDGMVYVSWPGFRNLTDEQQGALIAYNLDGSIKWEKSLNYGIASAPIIFENNIYLIAGNKAFSGIFNSVYKFDKNGNTLWQSNSEIGSDYLPVISSNKDLFLSENGSEIVGDRDGVAIYQPLSKVQIYNSVSHSLVWEEDLEKNSSIDSQAFVSNNNLFVVVKTIYEENRDIVWGYKKIGKEIRIYNETGLVSKLSVGNDDFLDFAVNGNGEIYALAVGEDGALKLLNLKSEPKIIELKLLITTEAGEEIKEKEENILNDKEDGGMPSEDFINNIPKEETEEQEVGEQNDRLILTEELEVQQHIQSQSQELIQEIENLDFGESKQNEELIKDIEINKEI